MPRHTIRRAARRYTPEEVELALAVVAECGGHFKSASQDSSVAARRPWCRRRWAAHRVKPTWDRYHHLMPGTMDEADDLIQAYIDRPATEAAKGA